MTYDMYKSKYVCIHIYIYRMICESVRKNDVSRTPITMDHMETVVKSEWTFVQKNSSCDEMAV